MQSIKEIVERLRNIEFEPVDVGSTGVAWTLKDPDVLDDIADALEALLAESGNEGDEDETVFDLTRPERRLQHL